MSCNKAIANKDLNRLDVKKPPMTVTPGFKSAQTAAFRVQPNRQLQTLNQTARSSERSPIQIQAKAAMEQLKRKQMIIQDVLKMQTNISSVLQNFTDSYRGSYQNAKGGATLSPISHQEELSIEAPKIGGLKAACEPHIKISSETIDANRSKPDTIKKMSMLPPFYMQKLKANANIRLTAAT